TCRPRRHATQTRAYRSGAHFISACTGADPPTGRASLPAASTRPTREPLMSSSPLNTASASCACGNVELELRGPPIMIVSCYCDSCQEGGRRIEALPNAPPVLQPDGGTPYI